MERARKGKNRKHLDRGKWSRKVTEVASISMINISMKDMGMAMVMVMVIAMGIRSLKGIRKETVEGLKRESS